MTTEKIPGVVNFSEILKNRAELSSKAEKTSAFSRHEMAQRLRIAAKHGDEEVQKFRELAKNFSTEVEKLVLFENVGESFNEMFVHYILEQVLAPILANRKPYGMDDQTFKEVRLKLYKDLMDKYIK